MASVEPKFDVLNGQDPISYILSSNIARRHMNAGQRAMATAKAKLFPGNKITQAEAAQASGVTRERLAFASVILKHAPELTDRVISADMTLDEAYQRAKEEKDRKEGRDRTAEEIARTKAKLQRGSPYLANEVAEGRMALSAAWAAYEQQQHRPPSHERGPAGDGDNKSTFTI
jgi:hypothetical protein